MRSAQYSKLPACSRSSIRIIAPTQSSNPRMPPLTEAPVMVPHGLGLSSSFSSELVTCSRSPICILLAMICNGLSCSRLQDWLASVVKWPWLAININLHWQSAHVAKLSFAVGHQFASLQRSVKELVDSYYR